MEKNQISAEIVAHSTNQQGDELISVLCTFPRIILAEVNTHRMLSKNTSSSRAIPFNKMVEVIQTNPFIPIAWQKEHKGMQGSEYFTEKKDIINNEFLWLKARDEAINNAQTLSSVVGTTKQLCNRLLEPFMWTTMLITGPKSGWDNFFNLRCPSYRVGGKGDIASSTNTYKSKKNAIKDYPGSADEPDINWMSWNEGQAEIHMMALAECIYDAVNESTPEQLFSGQWHIPFSDKIHSLYGFTIEDIIDNGELPVSVKISTAMAAHTSYTTVGNESIKSYEKWIELHDKLIAYNPPHSSPFEHTARAMSDDEWDSHIKGVSEYDNFDIRQGGYSLSEIFSEKDKGWCFNLKGFISYRYLIDNKINL